MKLTSITLDNFGAYKGITKIDLKPKSNKRNIILFGGKNGAGKTTLLEAIKICLYGRNFSEKPLPEEKYQKILLEYIHTTKNTQNLKN